MMLVGLLKKADHNANLTETAGKIPSITDLALTSVLTAAESKVPNMCDLGKKTDYDAKIIKQIINLWLKYLMQR